MQDAEYIIYIILSLMPWLGISWMLGTETGHSQKTMKIFWLLVGLPTYVSLNIFVFLSLIHMHQNSGLEILAANTPSLLAIALFIAGIHLAKERKRYWVVAIAFNYLFSFVDELLLISTCYHAPGSYVFEQPYKADAGMVLFATTMVGFALFTLAMGKQNIRAPSGQNSKQQI